MKTRADVETLKRDWEEDPAWDIYNTDGFGEYRAELRAFQTRKETEWAEKIRRQELKDMSRMGLEPKNLPILYHYLKGLERRIATLESTEAAGRDA